VGGRAPGGGWVGQELLARFAIGTEVVGGGVPTVPV
jgi:hypothetical protein